MHSLECLSKWLLLRMFTNAFVIPDFGSVLRVSAYLCQLMIGAIWKMASNAFRTSSVPTSNQVKCFSEVGNLFSFLMHVVKTLQ